MEAGVAEAAGRVGGRRLIAVVGDYVALTKPRVISLLLLTTLAAMFVADPSGPPATTILFTLLGGYLAAGGAGAINHYLDRHIDARMSRTSTRPLVAGRIAPLHGLLFGIALGAGSFLLLSLAVNEVAALLALAGLLGYVFVYTMWLKPMTPQNIVIGGAAGAVPPLVGWAAATGSLELGALYLFAIVFFWTPPHFWALSLMIKEEYAKTGVPMLPVVRGEEETRRQILLYTVLMAPVVFVPVVAGLFGAIYIAVAAPLSIAFIRLARGLRREPGKKAALRLYLFSLAYLAVLFSAMAVDRVVA